MSQNLPPSNIIQVSLQGTPQGIAVPNINTVGLISQEVPIWYGTQSSEQYLDPNSVANDFGSNSKAAAIAQAFFAQNPNPVTTGGYLAIIPRLQNQDLPAFVSIQDITYTAVALGTSGNAITVAYTTGGTAGAEVVTVISNAISVQIASGASTASQIVAAIKASTAASALVTASIFGIATNHQVAPVSATNLSGGTASGLEPVHSALIRVANAVYFFGVVVDFVPTSIVTLSKYIQSVQQMAFISSNNKADFQPGGMLANLAASNLNNTRGLYYNDGTLQDTVDFAAAYASRGLSVNFAGALQASTMNMKQLVGFLPDSTLTQTDLNTCQSTGVDIYPPFGFQGLVATGNLFTSGANGFFDQIYNQFWMTFALQVAGFDYLAQTNTKIPQTETGMDGLKNAYRNVMQQAVTAGVLAPGAWNSSTVFGNVTNLINAVAAIGFYVYSLPVAQQSVAARNARQAPLIQIAAKMAGAIHTSSVVVQINL
jgi:hypothetical protein